MNEINNFRFGVMTLLFYGENTFLRMIANTAPFVEVIYVGYSKVPWSSYNSDARNKFSASVDSSIIEKSAFRDKIVLIEGEWPTEEAQRNAIAERARNDGIDYLIIQDADEFYLPEDFKSNLSEISKKPNFPAYRCPWTVFWKNTKYVIRVREHNGQLRTTVTTCPNFAINLNDKEVYFSSRRLVNKINESYMLSGLCLHLAWVLSDEEVWQKIKTWGHSHQFNGLRWFKEKWLAWTPKTKFIGHITRANYIDAILYRGQLPVELLDFPVLDQNTVPLNALERVKCFLTDVKSLLLVKAARYLKWLNN